MVMFETFSEKMKAIKTVISGIDKQFGRGSLMALGDVDPEPVLAIPSGSTAIDRGGPSAYFLTWALFMLLVFAALASIRRHVPAATR